MPEVAAQAAAVELLGQTPSIRRLLATALLRSWRRPSAGATLPERRVVLRDVTQDPGRLAAYARVCGFTLRDQVPPTWLHVLTFPLQVHLMAGRDFPFAMVGMVHVANSMTLHRPVDLSETLTLSSQAQGLRAHPRGATVDLVGEALVGEEVVWSGRSTYLVRGAAVPAAEQVASGPESGHAVQPIGEDAAPPVPPTARWRVPTEVGRQYAAVSGDANPIHVNALAARALGFPRAIAHGMWTHARMLSALDGRLPAAYRVDVEFRKPVLLPSTVSFGARRSGDGWVCSVSSSDGRRTHLDAVLTHDRADFAAPYPAV